MFGDLDQVVGEKDKSMAWTPAGNSVEVVAGEKCRLRVVA